MAALSALAADDMRADPAATLQIVEALQTLPPAAVAREIERLALMQVSVLWRNGWQPNEVVRQVRRATNTLGEALAIITVGAEHGRHASSKIDGRWQSQLDQLGTPRRGEGSGPCGSAPSH